MRLLPLLTTVAVLATGCGMFEGEPETPADARPFRGTLDVTDVEHDVPRALLGDYEVEEMSDFDRLVFEFGGQELPGYRIEYTNTMPDMCLTGAPAEVKGEHFLVVTLTPAHSQVGDTWQSVSFENMAGIRETCNRKRSVTYAIGVDRRAPYRVRELQNPSRLVIDVGHVRQPRTAQR